jgi:type III secretion system (T3SS) SseB-like protein
LGLFDRLRLRPRPEPRPDPPPASEFEPSNDLERAVSAVFDGSGSFEEFVSCLLRSQVFVLIEGEPTPIPEIAGTRSLVLPSSRGIPSVCLFTSSERSYDVQRANPTYRTGLLVDFRWILPLIPADLGLVLNPGSSLSLEQLPEGVAKLKADLASSPAP